MNKIPLDNLLITLLVMSFTEAEDRDLEPPTADLFVCMDCEVDTKKIREYFMVEDDIWAENVPEHRGFLCVGCLEDRMGRELEANDFPSHLPINSPDGLFFPHSERLRARLTTE